MPGRTLDAARPAEGAVAEVWLVLLLLAGLARFCRPALAAVAAAAQLQAANVEAPQARNGVEVVSTSPNGTPDKAAKARAAKTFRAYLPSQCHRTYSCVHCR